MTLEHKKPPGRKKYQSAKALDPTNDFWANIDVNTFGVWADHPLRALAAKVATVRLQQDHDKKSPKATAWLLKNIKELQVHMGTQMTEMALQGNTKPFNDFAEIIEFFSTGKCLVDRPRSSLMISHKKLQLDLHRDPTQEELLVALKGINELYEMDLSDLGKMRKEMGLKLTLEKDIKTLRKEYALLKMNSVEAPQSKKFFEILRTQKHPLANENLMEFQQMCARMGLVLQQS